jgi:hypothetical protein
MGEPRRIKVGEPIQLDDTYMLDEFRQQLDQAETTLKELGATEIHTSYDDVPYSDWRYLYVVGYRLETPEEVVKREAQEEERRKLHIRQLEEQLRRLQNV